MADEATLTLTLDPTLHDRFVAEADAALQPAEDVLRDLVREFVERRHAARGTEIDQALREADDPDTTFVSHEEVEADWLRQRETLIRRIGDGTA